MLKTIGIKAVCILPLKRDLKNYFEKLNYKKMGGGIFLGIKKPIIKAHGSSNSEMIYYALMQAYNVGKIDISAEIEKAINEDKEEKIEDKMIERD